MSALTACVHCRRAFAHARQCPVRTNSGEFLIGDSGVPVEFTILLSCASSAVSDDYVERARYGTPQEAREALASARRHGLGGAVMQREDGGPWHVMHSVETVEAYVGRWRAYATGEGPRPHD